MLDYTKVEEMKTTLLPPKLKDTKDFISDCMQSYEYINSLVKDGKMVTSGLKSLDSKLMGFLPTEMTILQADAGVGKTNLALNILAHNITNKKNCLFFSLEMSGAEVMSRLANIMHKVDGGFSRGILEGEELDENAKRMMEFANYMSSLDNWCIIDTQQMLTKDADEIVAMSMYIKEVKGWDKVDLIVIDYLQYIAPKFLDKEEYVNQVYNLHRIEDYIDKEGSALILISCSNAGGEIKGGTNAKYDADVVMFLSKEEDGTIEITIKKNRHGQSGSLKYFQPYKSLRFVE